MTLTELLNRVAMIAIAAVVVGLVGRRWRPMRVLLVGLAPLGSAAILFYFFFEGSASQCSGSGATLRCWEVSYASAIWGWSGWSVGLVGSTVILTLAPIASAWLRRSWPSVAATCALPFLIGPLIVVLFPWAYVWPAVLGAAIAGPPSRQAGVKETADVLA